MRVTSTGRSRYRHILSGVLILTAVFAFAGSGNREPAPRFVAKTISGETFATDSLKGKVVLVQFWTTWCPYCRSEQPFVDNLHRDFGSHGLVVLAVDVGESNKKVRGYLEEHPRSCRIVLTEDTNLAARFEAKSFPVYVLIDREGNIAGTQRGAGGEEALRDLLSRAGLESE